MIRKYKIAFIFLTCSLFFALLSLQDSSALSKVSFDRDVKAKIVSDSNSILKLEGLDGKKSYDIEEDFTTVGYITNQSDQVMELVITATPEILYATNNSYKFYVKVDNNICEFRHNMDVSQQMTLMLSPGQKIEMEAGLKYNKAALVVTSLQISASDMGKTYQIQLTDTTETPRRFTVY
jgi:hypothetical protein